MTYRHKNKSKKGFIATVIWAVLLFATIFALAVQVTGGVSEKIGDEFSASNAERQTLQMTADDLNSGETIQLTSKRNNEHIKKLGRGNTSPNDQTPPPSPTTAVDPAPTLEPAEAFDPAQTPVPSTNIEPSTTPTPLPTSAPTPTHIPTSAPTLTPIPTRAPTPIPLPTTAPTPTPTNPTAQPVTVAASAFYVSLSGSDANAGTQAAPWRTIQKAADMVRAGNTVYIRGGTYKERVLLKTSGASGAFITFSNYPGETVVLDGTGIALTQARGAIFDTNARSYVIINGLRVINSDYFGIGDMAGETSYGHDLIVKNCTTYNTGSCGITFFWGRNITISNNIVELSNTNGAQEAISLHGIQGFTINGNEVFDGLKEGIDAKGGSSNGKIFDNYVHDLLGGEWDMNGIYIDAYDRDESNIEVYNNLVERCGNGIIVGAENNGSCHDINIHDNIIKFCRAGFNVSGWGIGTSHTVYNIIFNKNTIIGTTDNAITFSNASARNIRLTNNRLGGRYSSTDAIEMTNGVTSVDPSVFIDGNALCRLGTKASSLNGTNYTLLPSLDTP